jgi:hypothetical protein
MSKLPAQPPVIRLRLEDASGVPLKDASYTFEWREVPGHHVASQTNADGVLTEPILHGAARALRPDLDRRRRRDTVRRCDDD